MRSIPAEVIGEIKDRVDIVATIGDYVRLKRAGTTYKGLCPFHQEKTPSFNVHPEKRIYHCFGCGAGGDVISFLRKIDNKSFPEVVEKLAAQTGVDLSPYRDDDDTRGVDFSRLYEVMWAAQDFFRAQLRKNQDALSYLERRGISQESIDDFGIGFAQDSWTALEKALKKRHFSEEEMLESGLVKARAEKNGCYDYFRNRLTIPIHNSYGKIVAFGARSFDDSQDAKYLNSPETKIYSKGRLLFNLDRAVNRREVVEDLILVEGYFDVIALHQWGFRQAIASLGTALTQRQVRMIQKHTRRLLIAYDSDQAGIKATMRALKVLADSDIELRVLNLPKGQDPDDLLRAQGRKAMMRAIETAQRIERYLCDAICDSEEMSSSYGRERALKRLIPLFAQLPSIVSKQNLIRIMADRLDLSEEVVRRSLMQRRRRASKLRGAAVYDGEHQSSVLSKRPKSKGANLERQLICCFLNEVSLFHQHKKELEVEQFSDPFCKRILQRLFKRDNERETGPIYEEFLAPEAEEDDPQNRFITKEVLSSEVGPETAEQVVLEALRTMKKQRLDARKKELLQLIKECSDFSLQTQYAKELNEISRTLSNIQ